MRARRAALALLGAAASSLGQAQGPLPVRVVDPWVRACRAGTTCGAYVTIENRGRDTVQLMGASSDVAPRTELHETMLHDGQAHMMAHPTATIPPGGRLEGTPGKWHVMLVGVGRPLAVGDTVTITFRVRVSGAAAPPRTLVVRAPVRAP